MRRALATGAVVAVSLASMTALSLQAAAGVPTVVTVSPVADTFANAGAPNTNYGSNAVLSSRGTVGAASYLRFKVPAAPVGQSLVGAVLRVHTSTDAIAGSVDSHTVQIAGNSWAENTLTWNNRPAISGTLLGTLAGASEVNKSYDVTLGVSALAPYLDTTQTLGISSTGTDSLYLWSNNYAGTSSRPKLLLSFAAEAVPEPVTALVDLPPHSAIVAAEKQAADYYRGTYAHATVPPPLNGWSWSTYFQGVLALYQQSGDAAYLNDALAWGNSNLWGITTLEANPDSMKAGQTYFDLHAIDASASLTAMDTAMARDLAGLPTSQYDWIDALFMGLPNWTRWAARTGNTAYLDKMDALYAWTRDNGGTSNRCAGTTPAQPGLYDATQQLWYRDCTFVGKTDANGKPIFWSRGNGWVIAALAQVLQTLPPGDPRGTKYADMLQAMAARLVQLQGSDGFWRTSLLDPALYPAPETSGTALITFALAYGIRTHLLDAPTYLPAVAKAWQGLTTYALQSNGFVRGCQPVGSDPSNTYTATAPRTAPTSTSAGTVNSDSPPFCLGAFLLAGSAVAQLTSSPSTGQPVAATAEQTGNEAARVDDGDVTTRWSAEGFPNSVTIDLGAPYRISNAMVVPYLDRAYRYQIDTSLDNAQWQTVVDRSTNTSTGTRLDNFAGGTVNARYVRLTVVGVYGDSTNWVSIQEFGVYDRFDPRVDLALARPTTATTSLTGYPSTNATDGLSTTWWSAVNAPTATAPQNLTVDLGASAPIDTVRIFSRAGSGAQHVTVDVSTDGTNYTSVASVNLPDTEGPHAVVFPAVSARWVRLGATTSYSTSTVAIEQLEVFHA